MMTKNIRVTKESETGRNETFKKPNGQEISRRESVAEIKKGNHPDYHIRKINDIETPVSNPDKSEGNNLN